MHQKSELKLNQNQNHLTSTPAKDLYLNRSSPSLPLQHLISATSEQLFDVTGGLGRFGDVTVVLPSAWASTECADGLETTVSDE